MVNTKDETEMNKNLKRIMNYTSKGIRRELKSYMKRVKYLEGKEFYESIKKDILQNDN